MKVDQDLLKEIDDVLTKEIRARQDYILEKIRIRLGYSYYSFQRFNGLFGGKNNTYVDSVRTQFSDFNDFYAQWLRGVITQYERRTFYEPQPNHNALLLQDSDIEHFVRLFLERNFYRNIKERTRIKPEEQLWSVWFGYSVIFGLIIAPIYVGDKWIIDKSEIRRAKYEYWTIGHIFKEGLIDNDNKKRFTISDLNQFESVYLSIFKKLSNSEYEKRIYEKYIEYLNNSTCIEEEPFLIPEIRYAGLEKEHKHRLDFTVLNPYLKQYIGFEISPASTHMSISNLKGKQKEANEELSKKWDKEMSKRNDYFNSYGITIITFTEKMLGDFELCWNKIEVALSSRSNIKTSIQEQLKKIKGLK